MLVVVDEYSFQGYEASACGDTNDTFALGCRSRLPPCLLHPTVSNSVVVAAVDDVIADAAWVEHWSSVFLADDTPFENFEIHPLLSVFTFSSDVRSQAAMVFLVFAGRLAMNLSSSYLETCLMLSTAAGATPLMLRGGCIVYMTSTGPGLFPGI